MSLQTAHDVPLLISSAGTSSERRVTPSWTISQFRTRLEPITGIPSTCQNLSLRVPGRAEVSVSAADEDAVQVGSFGLVDYAELYVHDTRPPGTVPNYTDPSTVEKYTLPAETYASLPSTVLAYKRTHQLGRFSPSAPSTHAAQIALQLREISERHISVGRRCRLLPESSDDRRGTVRYVGEVEGIPGVGAWVGVELDEPTGRNDGSVQGGKRYFECGKGRGVFVRAERVEVGDFPAVDDFGEEMEEI